MVFDTIEDGLVTEVFACGAVEVTTLVLGTMKVVFDIVAFDC